VLVSSRPNPGISARKDTMPGVREHLGAACRSCESLWKYTLPVEGFESMARKRLEFLREGLRMYSALNTQLRRIEMDGDLLALQSNFCISSSMVKNSCSHLGLQQARDIVEDGLLQIPQHQQISTTGRRSA
jgi:hypothetical protein